MKIFKHFTTEAAIHPMGVHAYPTGKTGQFKVHAIGSKVKHVGVGDTVRSSDLDDLHDAGHKIKEIKRPMSEEVEQMSEDMAGLDSKTFVKKYNDNENANRHSENVVHLAKHFGTKADYNSAVDILNQHKQMGHLPRDLGKKRDALHNKLWKYAEPHFKNVNEEVELDEARNHSKSQTEMEDAHFMKQSKKMQDAINLHLRRGHDYNEAVKRAKVHVKEEVEAIDEISSSTLVSYSQKAHKQVKGNQPADPDKLRKRTNREQGIKLAFNKHYQFRTKVPATVSNNEEVELVDESGLSTKTLANYSIKASAATTDKDLPMKKTGNRYAGVSKVDKILAARDKKKVD